MSLREMHINIQKTRSQKRGKRKQPRGFNQMFMQKVNLCSYRACHSRLELLAALTPAASQFLSGHVEWENCSTAEAQ